LLKKLIIYPGNFELSLKNREIIKYTCKAPKEPSLWPAVTLSHMIMSACEDQNWNIRTEDADSITEDETEDGISFHILPTHHFIWVKFIPKVNESETTYGPLQ